MCRSEGHGLHDVCMLSLNVSGMHEQIVQEVNWPQEVFVY